MVNPDAELDTIIRSDWKLFQTFLALNKVTGKPTTSVSFNDLRKCYLLSTNNYSRSSLIDFIGRCIALNILTETSSSSTDINKKYKINPLLFSKIEKHQQDLEVNTYPKYQK
jgi:hypothetical protein